MQADNVPGTIVIPPTLIHLQQEQDEQNDQSSLFVEKIVVNGHEDTKTGVAVRRVPHLYQR